MRLTWSLTRVGRTLDSSERFATEDIFVVKVPTRTEKTPNKLLPDSAYNLITGPFHHCLASLGESRCRARPIVRFY